MTRNELTPADHQILGMNLAVAADLLGSATNQVAQAYRQDSPQVVRLREAVAALEEARSALDETMHLQSSENETMSYFPAPATVGNFAMRTRAMIRSDMRVA